MTQKSTGGINKNYKHLPRRNFFKTGRCCRGADVMLAVAVSPSSVGRGQDFGVLSPPWSSRIRGMKIRRRPWMLVMFGFVGHGCYTSIQFKSCERSGKHFDGVGGFHEIVHPCDNVQEGDGKK